MRSEWIKCRLDDCSLIIDSLHQTPLYVENGFPMVRVTDIKEGYLNLSNCTYVDESVFLQFTQKYNPQINDIVISRVGTYGVFSYVNTKESFCLGQNTAIISPKINSKYLYYFLISPETKQQVNAMVVGSTQKTLSLKNIRNLMITLPPDNIQQSIAATLSCLDDKIELNNKINTNLEAQAQAIFKSWFIDFEPFQDGGFEESELGLIPKGWRCGTLGDIAEITMGQSPSGSSYNDIAEGIVFYQGRAEFGWRFPSNRLYTTEPNRMAKKGDVLMSVRAPVGDINVANEDCCIGRGLSAIHSKSNHDSFVLYTMISLKRVLDKYNGEGTVFGSINRKDLHSISVIIPPEKTISEYETLCKPIDTMIFSHCKEILRLAAIRDALLPKLMSGEIEIPTE